MRTDRCACVVSKPVDRNKKGRCAMAKKVLIVDDETNIAEQVVEVLNDESKL